MANLQGLDLVLELRAADTGDFKFLVCETSSGFSGSTATNTTATKCDGGTPAVGLGTSEYNVTYSGAVMINPDVPTQITYKDVLVWWKTKQLLDWKRTKDGVVQLEGQGYITEISDSAETDGVVTFDITILGTGELQIYGDGQS